MVIWVTFKTAHATDFMRGGWGGGGWGKEAGRLHEVGRMKQRKVWTTRTQREWWSGWPYRKRRFYIVTLMLVEVKDSSTSFMTDRMGTSGQCKWKIRHTHMYKNFACIFCRAVLDSCLDLLVSVLLKKICVKGILKKGSEWVMKATHYYLFATWVKEVERGLD